MNATKIITVICSLMLTMVGVDHFLSFLEPPCSVMDSFPTTIWQILGGLQLIGGILIWFPKYRKGVAGFFLVFMLGFTLYHLIENTYDIGGSTFMAIMLALLVWDPAFLSGKGK